MNIFLPVCTSGLFSLKCRVLDRVIETISRLEDISALDASPYKPSNTVFRAASCHVSKRRAARMDEMVFGLYLMQTNALWERSCRRNKFSTRVSNQKALRIEKDGSHLVRSFWSTSLGNIRSERSLETGSSSERGIAELVSHSSLVSLSMFYWIWKPTRWRR